MIYDITSLARVKRCTSGDRCQRMAICDRTRLQGPLQLVERHPLLLDWERLVGPLPYQPAPPPTEAAENADGAAIAEAEHEDDEEYGEVACDIKLGQHRPDVVKRDHVERDGGDLAEQLGGTRRHSDDPKVSQVRRSAEQELVAATT